MALTIRVYTKPSCTQCDATKRRLNEKGFDYEIDDATEEGNLAAIRYLGMGSAPVVVAEDPEKGYSDMWAGFRPDKIDDLAKEYAS